MALLEAIRNDKPHNEVKRGVEASVVCNMGRMATNTGQEITYDEALNHDHKYAPNLDKLTAEGPVAFDARYQGPLPQTRAGVVQGSHTGKTQAREFAGREGGISEGCDCLWHFALFFSARGSPKAATLTHTNLFGGLGPNH